MFLKDWRYDGNDPGLKLFTLANPLLPGMDDYIGSVLEVGCRDTDFMERVDALGGSVNGIDWCERSPTHKYARKANILTVEHHSDFNYDAIIALSTIEHIGLGRYDHDPIDVYGDIKAVQRLRDMIDSGFIYFDVPYAPEGYHLLGKNKCRVYDDQSLIERFGPHTVLGYTSPLVEGWEPKPTMNYPDTRHPFWYVAILIERA